jgi:hypothetical protein
MSFDSFTLSNTFIENNINNIVVVEFSNLIQSTRIQFHTIETSDLDLDELDTSQMFLLNDRLTHQTSKRDQSLNKILCVQSKNDFFQIFHLINLRKLFITQAFSFTFSSTNSNEAQIFSIASSKISTFLKEYFDNALSIVTRHFDYQSLQNLIQRNFDFLISILSRKLFKLISKHSAESSSTHVIQNSSISIKFTKSNSFDSDSKKRS